MVFCCCKKHFFYGNRVDSPHPPPIMENSIKINIYFILLKPSLNKRLKPKYFSVSLFWHLMAFSENIYDHCTVWYLHLQHVNFGISGLNLSYLNSKMFRQREMQRVLKITYNLSRPTIHLPAKYFGQSFYPLGFVSLLSYLYILR